MRTHPSILLAPFILAILAFGGPRVSAAEEVISVAVINFTSSPESTVEGEDMATLLTTLLSDEPSLLLVERSDLSKILGEFELNLSGTADPGAISKIGHLTGADVIVTGRMFQTGETHFIASKVISVSTGRVFGDLAEHKNGESIADAASQLSEKIAKRIVDNRKDLFPSVESPEARIARLKKQVEGKKLPSVFISIPEEHFSRTVPDPAAQTEIQKTLQEVGFQLVDQQSAAKSIITGEAFSELGARHANLVSCRARIEVVVKRNAKDAAIQVERETSVAADLSENIAAKSALQRGGSTLAERLIALLVE